MCQAVEKTVCEPFLGRRQSAQGEGRTLAGKPCLTAGVVHIEIMMAKGMQDRANA